MFEAFKDNPPRDEELAALIGISFRLSSSALVFTSDVMTNYGFIKPANVILTRNTKMDDYAQVSLRVGFTDYFHEYAWPYYQKTTTAKTRDEFAQLQSLDVDSGLPDQRAQDRRRRQPRRHHPRARAKSSS